MKVVGSHGSILEDPSSTLRLLKPGPFPSAPRVPDRSHGGFFDEAIIIFWLL